MAQKIALISFALLVLLLMGFSGACPFSASRLDQLNEQDTVLVISNSAGCFGGDSIRVKIYMANNALHANYSGNHHHGGNTVVMSSESVHSFKALETAMVNFEPKLKCSSTTRLSYYIIFQQDTNHFTSNSCAFPYFTDFINTTFGFPAK